MKYQTIKEIVTSQLNRGLYKQALWSLWQYLTKAMWK